MLNGSGDLNKKQHYLLMHYDINKPLILACDAPPFEVVVVLSHRLDDGTEKSTSNVFRTLAPPERKYLQLDKETLAIILEVKHYHQYLYRRQFIFLSHHKPLMHIFSESKSTPAMASARKQWWQYYWVVTIITLGISQDNYKQMLMHLIDYPS